MPASSTRSPSTTWRPAPGCPGPTSAREFRRAFGEVTSPVSADPPTRAGGVVLLRDTDRPIDRDLPLGRAGKAWARSPPASDGCSARPPRPTGRRSRPPQRHVRIPRCVAQAYGRPQNRTFREDEAARPSRVTLVPTNPAAASRDARPRRLPDDQDRQRPVLGTRPGRGTRVLHPDARLGGPLGRDHASLGLPVAGGRTGRPGRCRAGADAGSRTPDARRRQPSPARRPGGRRASAARCSSRPTTARPPTTICGPGVSSSTTRPPPSPTGSTRPSATRPATTSGSPRSSSSTRAAPDRVRVPRRARAETA